MAMVMWTLWHRRNQLRIHSCVLPKEQIFQQALQALATFQQSQRTLTNHAAATCSQHSVQWRPLPKNCLKLNFDGTTFLELGKVGLGVVVRDSHGNAIASLSEQAPLPFAPVIVEAMATTKAMTFA